MITAVIVGATKFTPTGRGGEMRSLLCQIGCNRWYQEQRSVNNVHFMAEACLVVDLIQTPECTRFFCFTLSAINLNQVYRCRLCSLVTMPASLSVTIITFTSYSMLLLTCGCTVVFVISSLLHTQSVLQFL